MNHVMAFVLRLAYVAGRQGMHQRAVALIGKIPPPGFVHENAGAWWAFADICDAADELERPRCHHCGNPLNKTN